MKNKLTFFILPAFLFSRQLHYAELDQKLEMMRISEEYNMQTIHNDSLMAEYSHLPSLNSPEELLFYINRQKAFVEDLENQLESTLQRAEFGLVQASANCNSMNGNYSQHVGAGIFNSISFNSITYYTYCEESNAFESVTSIYSSMTGLTLGSTYFQIGYSNNVFENCIHYTINGIMDHYLIISGV